MKKGYCLEIRFRTDGDFGCSYPQLKELVKIPEDGDFIGIRKCWEEYDTNIIQEVIYILLEVHSGIYGKEDVVKNVKSLIESAMREVNEKECCVVFDNRNGYDMSIDFTEGNIEEYQPDYPDVKEYIKTLFSKYDDANAIEQLSNKMTEYIEELKSERFKEL